MEKSLKSISSNYGLYLGLALAAISILVYAFAIDLFLAWWFGILLIVLIIVIGLMSALKAKNNNGGFISFKEAFTAYFITIAIGTLISTIVGVVIFNFVDPDSAEYINEKVITMTKETMENIGAPQESINETMAKMEDTNSFSIAAQVQSYFVRLALLSVLGLLVAAVVKRNDPNEA